MDKAKKLIASKPYVSQCCVMTIRGVNNGKKLSEMTLEEPWKLFPIFLTEHQDFWRKWYLEEEILLKSLMQMKKISHIGSTSIPAIWAKPIVDILVEIPKENKDVAWQ